MNAAVAISASTASISYAAFLKAVTNACKVSEKRSTVPVLENLHIKAVPNGVQVCATDLDLFTTTFVPGIASRDFECVVPAHKLLDVMKKAKASDSISFSLEGDVISARIGKLSLTLTPEQKASDFPHEAAFRTDLKKTNIGFVLPSATILKALDKVAFAISSEETRYYLNGVFLHANERAHEIYFVATDGHRMGCYAVPTPAGAGAMSETGYIIPSKTVTELQRLLKRKDCPAETMVSLTDNGISFMVGEDELLESKLIDGSYPDYRRIIPQYADNRVSAEAAAIIDALKQASSVLTERNSAVKLTVDNGTLTVTGRGEGFGTASMTIPAETSGTLEIGFNVSYMLEIMNRMDGWPVIKMREKGDPVVITDTADTCITYVQMPMRT